MNSTSPHNGNNFVSEGFFNHVIFSTDGQNFSGASMPFDQDLTTYKVRELIEQFDSVEEFKKLIPYILSSVESTKCHCLSNDKSANKHVGPIYCPVCGRHNAKNIYLYYF